MTAPRDSCEIIEELIAMGEIYSDRERLPFSGMARLFDDAVAHKIMMITVRPLVEELSRAFVVEAL